MAWSQVKESAAHAIPGYLDPATGKFTTRVVPAATVEPNAQAAVAGTGIFFREDFQITVKNFDQPSNSTVFCIVEMTGGDSTYYSESSTVIATAGGAGWSCDVPILTLWTLTNPASATISATVSIAIVPGNTNSINSLMPGRGGSQTLSLNVPGNTQTVINTVTFQI